MLDFRSYQDNPCNRYISGKNFNEPQCQDRCHRWEEERRFTPSQLQTYGSALSECSTETTYPELNPKCAHHPPPSHPNQKPGINPVSFPVPQTSQPVTKSNLLDPLNSSSLSSSPRSQNWLSPCLHADLLSLLQMPSHWPPYFRPTPLLHSLHAVASTQTPQWES